jgi:hypothetical protein
MRVFSEQITADDADVLAGTQLDTLQEGGQLDVFLLSSQPDTLYSIFGPGNEPIVTNAEVMNETRSPRPNDDTPHTLVIMKAGHYTLDINIVTAATVILLAVFREKGIDF